MWEQLLPYLAAQQGGPGLADAFAGPAAPTMGSGQYGLESIPGMVGGIGAPGQVMGLPQGGPTMLGSQAQGAGPLLSTDANINKLAMAPLDPAKLAAIMGLGNGNPQQRAPQAPGSQPATGHGLTPGKQTAVADVRRPGALGIRG